MKPKSRGNQGESDSMSMHRATVQKKTCRLRCVLRSEPRRFQVALLSWLAAPVELLQSELIWLDQAGNGLYDIMIEDELNPVYTCRKRLQQLRHAGERGPLKPLYEWFGQDVLPLIGQVTLDFDGQVSWRFHYLTDFPYAWAKWCHPGLSSEVQGRVVDCFYNDFKKLLPESRTFPESVCLFPDC